MRSTTEIEICRLQDNREYFSDCPCPDQKLIDQIDESIARHDMILRRIQKIQDLGLSSKKQAWEKIISWFYLSFTHKTRSSEFLRKTLFKWWRISESNSAAAADDLLHAIRDAEE